MTLKIKIDEHVLKERRILKNLTVLQPPPNHDGKERTMNWQSLTIKK